MCPALKDEMYFHLMTTNRKGERSMQMVEAVCKLYPELNKVREELGL